MPRLLEDTRAIMRWIAELSPGTYVNVMNQYYPAWKAKTDERYRDINRGVEAAEMDIVSLVTLAHGALAAGPRPA